MTQVSSTSSDEAYLSEMNHMFVTRLAGSGWFSRALAAAARLGVADLVAQRPMTAEEVAAATGTDPHVMRRLLQMLKVWAVFDRDEDERYSLTDKFAPLRDDHPWSMRNYCILMAETYDDAFVGITETLRTGKSGFRAVFGVTLYEWLERAENAEMAGIFDKAMAELSRPAAAILARQRDFTDVRTVVDVGGGGGGFVSGLVAAHPHLQGICADRASVCARGPERLAQVRGEEVAARVSFQPSDIFESVPDGGDLYLLKNVLHDWTEESGVRILKSINAAMRRTAEATGRSPRLLVLEPLVETDFDAVRAMFQVVVCEEGTGFDGDDLRRMIETAGLSLVSTAKMPSNHTVFECALPDA